MRSIAPAVLLVVLGAASGCLMHRTPGLPAPIPPVAGTPRTAFALRELEVKPGYGALAAARKCLFVHYTGWLTTGRKFDSSRDSSDGRPGQPFGFAQGARQVIVGWDQGFEGMRVGGQRRLFIPYQLAYGETGSPPVIPPKAELVFDVELMAVADTLAHADAARARCPTWAAVSALR